MKNYTKTGWVATCVIAVSLLSVSAFSQTQSDGEKEQLKLAKKYRLGIYRDADLKKTYKIYNELANKKSPEALVELGNMYLRGEGITQDYAQAFNNFQEAANLGYAPALCRLALMYQKGIGKDQNFSKAFELYDLAAKKGDVGGYYGAGYLMYKGFGVTQNYDKALEYFQKGADKNDARCEYMLACHELAGYGKNQDVEKGEKYMERAMDHGHPWVKDVIYYYMVDSLSRNYKRNPNGWTDVKNGRINHVKRTVANNATTEKLSGEWSGKVYTYDWAGNKIESEEKIRLIIKGEDNSLTLQWFSNDTLRTSCNAQKTDNGWTAAKGRRYDPSSKTGWYISSSRFDTDTKGGKEILYADFTTYGVDTNEPCQPRIAVLERKN